MEGEKGGEEGGMGRWTQGVGVLGEKRVQTFRIHELADRKTKTKVITMTNHNRRRQSDEPIRTRSKHM